MSRPLAAERARGGAPLAEAFGSRIGEVEGRGACVDAAGLAEAGVEGLMLFERFAAS